MRAADGSPDRVPILGNYENGWYSAPVLDWDDERPRSGWQLRAVGLKEVASGDEKGGQCQKQRRQTSTAHVPAGRLGVEQLGPGLFEVVHARRLANPKGRPKG